MKILKQAWAWVQADDVSNDLGGGCLMSAVRIFIIVMFLAALVSGIITQCGVKI